jgi:hypothetical protein
MNTKKLFTIIGLTAVLFLSWGCERKGPAERTGEQIDRAIERTGEELDEAGEAIRERAEDAQDRRKGIDERAGEELEKAGEAIEDAAEGR